MRDRVDRLATVGQHHVLDLNARRERCDESSSFAWRQLADGTAVRLRAAPIGAFEHLTARRIDEAIESPANLADTERQAAT
jgi:hypothetical protein